MNNSLQKISQHFKKSRANFTIYSFLSFFLPVIAVLSVFFILKIHPFGNQSVLSYDFANQYISYFYYIKENGIFNTDAIYSTSMTFGGNFFGVVAYYLLSPFNLLIYLWPENHLIELMTLMTVLKIGTIGSTTYYLFNRWGSVDKPNKNPAWALAFSLIVALSQYIGAYANNIMWLDAIIFLPMIIYGIERILAGKSAISLAIFVGLSMIFQYYLTVMVLLFAAIYFILRYFQLYGRHFLQNINKALTTIYAVFTGLLLSSPIWLTGFVQARAKKESLASNWDVAGYQFEWIKQYHLQDLLRNALGIKQFNIFDGGSQIGNMMLSLGIFTSVIFALIFIFSRQKWSIKISWLILPLILIGSVLFKNLDLVWMGFTNPLGFPHRYLFLFSFAIAVIGIDLINQGFYFKLSKKQMTTIAVVAAGVFLVNAGYHFNQAQAWSKDAQRINVSQFNQFYQAERAAIDFAEKTDNQQNLKRVIASGTYSKNDPLMFNYPGISHYSSAESLELMNLTSNLGYMQRQIWYMWTGEEAGSTLSIDSLLNVNFYAQADQAFYKKVRPGLSSMSSYFGRQYPQLNKVYSGDIDLYQNKYAMPFGLVSNLSNNSKLSSKLDNRIDNLNKIWRNWTSTNTNILQENAVDRLDLSTYQIEVENSGLQYLVFNSDRDYDYDDHDIKSQVIVDGQKINQDFRSGVIDLGQHDAGDSIIVQLKLTGYNAVEEVKENITLQSFAEDLDILSEVSNDFRSQDTQTKIEGNKISAKFNLDSNQQQYLILSIPYDQAWEFYNNGQKVKPVKVNGSFIGVPLVEGENDIKGHYEVPYLFASYVLVGFGLIGLIVLYLVSSKRFENIFRIRK